MSKAISEVESNSEDNPSISPVLDQEYEFDDIYTFIQSTCFANKCEFLTETKNTIDICQGFLQLIHDELSFEELNALLVASCMLFSYKPTAENAEWREHFLHKTFRQLDTLHPVQIHLHSRKLWTNLISKNEKYILNVVTICKRIDSEGMPSKMIGICLAWKVISEMTDTEMTYFGLKKIANLLTMLQKLDIKYFLEIENISKLYITINTSFFLIFNIIKDDNEFLQSPAFREYFKYDSDTLEELHAWMLNAFDKLKAIIYNPSFSQQIYLSMLTYICVSNGYLENRITELKRRLDIM